MKKPLLSAFFVICHFLAFCQFASNISSTLQKQMVENPSQKLDVIILLNEQAPISEFIQDMRNATHLKRNIQQTAFLKMEKVAKESQPAMIQWMQNEFKCSPDQIRKYWIVNALGADVNSEEITKIANHPGVYYISEQPEFEADLAGQTSGPAGSISAPGQHEIGHDIINAPALWAMGYTGYGTKAYIHDTGVDIDHPALRSNFSYHNNPLDQAWKGNAEEPYVCGDHGSHVTGTVMGLDRVNNDTIGVAFNAQFMTTPQFTTCGNLRLDNLATWEWVLDPDGDPATTDELPNVMNMSGGRQVTDSICGNALMELLYMGLQLGDVAAIYSAGNSGPGPRTNGSPALHNFDLVHSFSVGNLNANSLIINESSSRGPSHCANPELSLFIKPEVSAPGTNVRSSIPGEQYAFFTGTSMAAPHTAGAFLLLREAYPFLLEKDLLEALYFSAVDYGEPGEDNEYGMGVIDVLGAFNWLIDQGYTPVPPLSNKYDLVAVEMQLDNQIYCAGIPKISLMFENAGTDTIYSVKINFIEEKGQLDTFSKVWNGVLAPDEIAEMEFDLPVEAPVGKHDISMSLQLLDNEEEVRLLNNQFKRRFRVFDEPPFVVDIQNTSSNEFCTGSRILLNTISEVRSDQTVNWYEGDIGINPIAIGQSYLTPPLEDDQMYIATLETNFKLGMNLNEADLEVGDDALGGLVFDVMRPLKIERFNVYAASAGGRLIELRDPFGETVKSKLISVPAGEKSIEVNWTINTPGNGYRIVLTAGKPFSHVSDVNNFPFEVDDRMAIQSGIYNGTIIPTDYYYFFDWEISTTHACGPQQIDVLVISSDTVSALEILSDSDTVFLSNGGLIDLTASNDSFSQYEWRTAEGEIFDGSSITTEFFEPGNYTVTLRATSQIGCTTNAIKIITVLNDIQTGIDEEKVTELIKVFPNPAMDKLFIQFIANTRQSGIINISMYDMFGRKVLSKKAEPANQTIEINTSSLAPGQYVMHILGQNMMVVVNGG